VNCELQVPETLPEIVEHSAVKPLIEVDVEIKQIVEALLFAADRPMTIRQLQQVFPELERPDSLSIQNAIDDIIQDYSLRPVELKLVASGYRFQVKERMAHWVSRLFEEKPPKYSRALLETLAIIAYRQPVTRGDIEDIRGVSVSSNIMRTLLEREWVRVVAHKEVPGRPAIYGTTKQFLDYFNISSLDELPTLQEILDLEIETNTPDSDDVVTQSEERIESSTEVTDKDEVEVVE
jgi:segregation and condensation protein B